MEILQELTKKGDGRIKQNMKVVMAVFVLALFIGMPVAFAGSATYDYEHNTITTHSICACGQQGDYKYHTQTFLNYCPACGRYGSLHYTHNEGSVEGRLTCGDGYGNGGCDFDACAVCGKNEIIGSHIYLIRAKASTPVVAQPQPIAQPISKIDMLKMQINQPLLAIEV